MPENKRRRRNDLPETRLVEQLWERPFHLSDRVVPGKEPEDLWPRNPQYEIYGEAVRLGRRRYRRRVLKIPPKRVGRPRREESLS